MTIVCSRPRQASCSSGCLRCFPAVTALVSSYGLFADPSTIGANLQTLALMLPEGSFQIVQDQIGRVLEQGQPPRSAATFLFGLALALWSANAGVKAMIDALNVVDERATRSAASSGSTCCRWRSRPAAIAALLLMVERGGGVSAGARSSRPAHRTAS